MYTVSEGISDMEVIGSQENENCSYDSDPSATLSAAELWVPFFVTKRKLGVVFPLRFRNRIGGFTGSELPRAAVQQQRAMFTK